MSCKVRLKASCNNSILCDNLTSSVCTSSLLIRWRVMEDTKCVLHVILWGCLQTGYPYLTHCSQIMHTVTQSNTAEWGRASAVFLCPNVSKRILETSKQTEEMCSTACFPCIDSRGDLKSCLKVHHPIITGETPQHWLNCWLFTNWDYMTNWFGFHFAIVRIKLHSMYWNWMWMWVRDCTVLLWTELNWTKFYVTLTWIRPVCKVLWDDISVNLAYLRMFDV